MHYMYHSCTVSSIVHIDPWFMLLKIFVMKHQNRLFSLCKLYPRPFEDFEVRMESTASHGTPKPSPLSRLAIYHMCTENETVLICCYSEFHACNHNHQTATIKQWTHETPSNSKLQRFRSLCVTAPCAPMCRVLYWRKGSSENLDLQ